MDSPSPFPPSSAPAFPPSEGPDFDFAPSDARAFPPSEAPGGSPASSSLPVSNRAVDPAHFDNVHGLGGSADEPEPLRERNTVENVQATLRRIPRAHDNTDAIPRVNDVTGEKVTESFQLFLENFTEDIAFPETPAPPTPLGPRFGNDGDDKDEDDDMGSDDRRKGKDNKRGTEEFVDEPYDGRPYIRQIKSLQEFELVTVYIDFTHLLEREETLARAIQTQYYRFLPFLRRGVSNLVKKYVPTYYYVPVVAAAMMSNPSLSPVDVREFAIAFYNLPLTVGIRDLRMNTIGQLLSISGTVTRTSEVRPELVSGTFKCGHCSTIVRDVEQQFKYTEPMKCPNMTCSNNRDWHLIIEQSKFTDWQKVRIQENSSEIPTGSMPRSLDVILRTEMVERAKAGDRCRFTGSFIVVPDVSQLGLPGANGEMMRENRGGRNDGGVASQGVTGLKALGVRDLQYKTAFLACMVQKADLRAEVRQDPNEELDPESYKASLTTQELDELDAMVRDENVYYRLISSIAPTVYGHEIVKKGILLQLLGGVHKQTQEGINLRGDINVCIVGDPSTSKSQFLKYVCGFLPRAIYTSGKASSAAGLTAAVVKDEETGEFTIEAGALMLADNGICAIDEFDKMDVADQVAIHEAMEQQTISIAKAGIQATLNARTSILAAANPVGGRYNRKVSLRANIAMSAPIMSRFDLFFVVLDECDETTDLNIARHIVNVHRFRDAAIAPDYSTEALQRYIRYARCHSPKLTSEAADVLVEKYRELRQSQNVPGKSNVRITVRQLESMIRLSEAIARAMCQEEITAPMVREAHSLLRLSIIHVEQDDINFDDEEDQALAAAVDAAEAQMDQDAADIAALEAAESSLQNGTGTASLGTSGRQSSMPASAPRPKMRITYNRYMEIMNLCVLHLSEVERTTGQGVDREELIQWYLEQRIEDLDDEAALEHEHELIGKALTKLAKDNYLLAIRGGMREGLVPSHEESLESAASDDVHYVVHPQVDLSDLSSSVPGPSA